MLKFLATSLTDGEQEDIVVISSRSVDSIFGQSIFLLTVFCLEETSSDFAVDKLKFWLLIDRKTKAVHICRHALSSVEC